MTIDVKDANGNIVTIPTPSTAGRASAAASKPVTLSNEDYAAIDGIETAIASTNTKLDTLHTDLATTLAGLVDGLEGILGTTSGAAVITDANGTVQQYLRGLVKRWVDALGTGTAAAALRTTLATDVGLPAGTALLGKVKTKFIAAVGSTLTRAANTTAYVAGYSISNNVTAGSVTANTVTISDLNNEPVMIERVRIVTTDTGIGTHSVRMWLFNSDPTANSGVQAGDGAAYSQKKAGLVGSLSGTFRAMQDGAFAVLIPDEGSRITTVPGSGAQTLWWQLQALDAFTPISASTFIPTFEGFQGGTN
ncbi:hypothetical protein EN851_07890 [Mesorhizobium sp. M8A.F.Ca.ET.208.01.1.1]|uniref:hypothetical protein n=1 Tax=unclassified Mesorhizobium TaxID=325217 RepID=UPI00109411A3|nr:MULTISPECIES: hypothetical protein [unclassified Mesorhizobium]TGQ95430.1 hypothetical protein EN851_07890 [Mesorhizobium sp. M8A.F.Ca.ET.208.01.1.1]TGT55921.1 hypothetical protein EN810_07890 [Mesorhizobium sp. M8A.F.Ca.ET.167.01.1.1]